MKTAKVKCIYCGRQVDEGQAMIWDAHAGETDRDMEWMCDNCFDDPKRIAKERRKQIDEDLKTILAQQDFKKALMKAFEPFEESVEVGPCGMGEKIPSPFMAPDWASKILKGIVDRYEVSLKDISDTMGINLKTVKRWEKGISGPANRTLKRIQENIVH